MAAVRALPDSQRQVIVRHAFNGETHEDIAADLGLAPGAIRQLAYRARGTLRAAAWRPAHLRTLGGMRAPWA